MIYLLDVNVLLAFGFEMHIHHGRVRDWLFVCQREQGEREVTLATCAITELGFIRIASGGARLAESVSAARAGLRRVKIRERFVFLGDDVEAEQLPMWVRKSAQTTDGHLVVLASEHEAQLVTLDRGIPGAYLIPEFQSIVRDSAPRAFYGRVA